MKEESINKQNMVIIIGGSKGLGRTVAHRLAKGQDYLLLSGRNTEALKTVAEEIQLTSKSKVFTKQIDLASLDDLNEFIQFVKQTGISVRALINTAAGFYKGQFTHLSPETIDSLINTTFTGPVRLISELINNIELTKPFDIINITSVSAATNLDASRSSSLHISTKAALHTFGIIAGRELVNSGIRICSIAPGTFERDGRKGIPENVIADCIEFVLNLPESTWIESIVLRPTEI